MRRYCQPLGWQRCTAAMTLLAVVSAHDCYQVNTYYDGPALAGGFKTTEANPEDCMMRCRDIRETCMYWSYYQDGGGCILMGRNAKKIFSKGWLSGPYDGCAVELPAFDANAPVTKKAPITTPTTTVMSAYPETTVENIALKHTTKLIVNDGDGFDKGDLVTLGSSLKQYKVVGVTPGHHGWSIFLDTPISHDFDKGSVLRIIKKPIFFESSLLHPVAQDYFELDVKDGSGFSIYDTIMLGGRSYTVMMKRTHGKHAQLTLNRPIAASFWANSPVVVIKKGSALASSTLKQKALKGAKKLFLTSGEGFSSEDTIVIGGISYIIEDIRWDHEREEAVLTLNQPLREEFGHGAKIMITKKKPVGPKLPSLPYNVPKGSKVVTLPNSGSYDVYDAVVIDGEVYIITAKKGDKITFNHPTSHVIGKGTSIQVSKKAGVLHSTVVKKVVKKNATKVHLESGEGFKMGDTVKLGGDAYIVSHINWNNDRNEATAILTSKVKHHIKPGAAIVVTREAGAKGSSSLQHAVAAGSKELHLGNGKGFDEHDTIRIGGESYIVTLVTRSAHGAVVTLDHPLGHAMHKGANIKVVKKWTPPRPGSVIKHGAKVGANTLHIANGAAFDKGDTIKIGNETLKAKGVVTHVGGGADIHLNHTIQHHHKAGAHIRIKKKPALPNLKLQHPPQKGAVEMTLPGSGKGFSEGYTVVLGGRSYLINRLFHRNGKVHISFDHPIQASLKPGESIRVSQRTKTISYGQTTLKHSIPKGATELHLDDAGYGKGDTLRIGGHSFLIRGISYLGHGHGRTAVVRIDRPLLFSIHPGWSIMITGKAAKFPEGQCFAKDMKYKGGVLADMSGRGRSVFECRAHCYNTEGCARFSFWLAGDYCILHTEDSVLIKDETSKDYMSGPPKCGSKQNGKSCWVPRPECVQDTWTYKGKQITGCAHGRTPCGWCSLVHTQPGPWLACENKCVPDEESSSSAGVLGSSSAAGGSSSIPPGLLIVLLLLILCIAFAVLYVLGYPPFGKKKKQKKVNGRGGIVGYSAPGAEVGGYVEVAQTPQAPQFQASVSDADGRVVLQPYAPPPPQEGLTLLLNAPAPSGTVQAVGQAGAFAPQLQGSVQYGGQVGVSANVGVPQTTPSVLPA